ncbi:Sec-independent protein translocase subunit TatA [Pseudonocardia alaniniphila]|uniref:Sec-independent protein translocase protein TatA n=1 Tax=Pseudonocardia alaniniphila TaxID=75291 RepID=A0ABS9TGM5_9PSEU|nr:Sec-independent protein translocase subunit TatA [Pseudonocardia alaniniphila]MCH6167563.1 Sec-independent protein translocase subunit TatA [Pseudonocardia alaniniphila]
MPSLGGWEFVILIGILVLLFGAKRLPDMARSIGQSARVFKGEMKGMKSDETREDAAGTTDKPAAQPAPPAPPAALPAAQPAQVQQPAQAQEPRTESTRTTQPGASNTGQ